MQSVKILTSELTWCLRCSMRIGVRKPAAQSLLSAAAIQRRFYTADAIPPAVLEGEEKKYAPKIEQIVKEIGQLNLVEVGDLTELLKKRLKIRDTPMMAVGAMPSPKAQEEEEAPEAKQEKVNFTVKLTKFEESKKVALIKEVKNLVTGMNLVQAKKFVETLPQSIKTDVPKEEAEKLKVALEAVGATVVLE